MMFKLETMISEEQRQPDAWSAQEAGEVAELNEMLEVAVVRTTTVPDDYLRYLDVQADNPAFSSANIMLALAQNPDVSMMRTMQGWTKLGRSVIAGEEGLKIRLTDAYAKVGRQYTGFRIGRAFDIGQTEGFPMSTSSPLEDHTPKMDIALRQMIRMSPVPIQTTVDSGIEAKYDPHEKVILLSADLSDTEAFAALGREIFHAATHADNRMIEYNAMENVLDAESVSYMLCRRYGIPREYPEASDVGAFYTDMDAKDRSSIVEGMYKSFRSMERSIQKELDPPLQSRINRGQSR